MLCSLPRSCLAHPVDCFDSEGWFGSDQVIFLTVFHVFWWKSMQHLSEKTISGCPVSPGSAEALVTWGGKIKYSLIAWFLGNIYAKNCRNWTMYVKITASCKGGTFFETQCSCSKLHDGNYTVVKKQHFQNVHFWSKKTSRYTLACNLIKCWLVFKIISVHWQTH